MSDFWESKTGCATIVIAVILVLALALTACSINIVPAGHVGVITRWGAINRVVYPGLSWKIPIAEGYEKMDTRTQLGQSDVGAASKDLQIVTSTVAVNFRIDGQYATDIYQSVGVKYKEILLDPAVENIFKATTAKFTAEELITKREIVRAAAEEALAEQMLVYHIIIENFNIVNFDFSDEFNAAIEAKQVAQQEVETAKQRLERAKVDAEAVRVAAEGQAEAAKALAASGALSPEYLQYLALLKWNGVLPTTTCEGGAPFVNVK